MFKLMGKETNAILGAQTILIWTYVPYKYQNLTEQAHKLYLYLEIFKALQYRSCLLES